MAWMSRVLGRDVPGPEKNSMQENSGADFSLPSLGNSACQAMTRLARIDSQIRANHLMASKTEPPFFCEPRFGALKVGNHMLRRFARTVRTL